ncbi:unnamed protein product [Closterium sp. NIES-64]|nr:unnamed protein product [Closterium sp. NIES-64]CAI6006273.1 unnamed protein product [Closterium sp. NIES-64]CAI6009227.1 unnamed protein product [Closterium sp. NIES-65]
MPAGGCHTRYVCPYIDNLATATISQSTYTSYKYIGDYQGLFNSQGGQFAPHQRGSGPVNFERYTEVGTIFDVVKGVYGDTLQECCRACARSTYCYQWHWFKNSRLAGENSKVAGFIDRIQCYLLEKNGGSGTSGSFKTPNAGDAATQTANAATYPLSFVGGLCNGTALVENDPHLTGAHGTHYDFTGRLDKSFCLFSDRRFHVNMHLDGYQGAPPAISASAKSNENKDSSTELHTWIKEVGVVWMTPDGANHTLRMVARKGKQQERGDNGFLSLLEVDGTTTAPPSVGESISTSGLVVTKVAEEKEGPFDVDQFKVRVAGLGELDVRVRVAHPLLQTPTEAEAHFNVELSDVKMTSAAHGVLGQTFRNSPEQLQRAVKYSHLAALLHHPVDVDKAEGRGFLDGEVEDYISSSVVAPDCKYASYGTTSDA